MAFEASRKRAALLGVLFVCSYGLIGSLVAGLSFGATTLTQIAQNSDEYTSVQTGASLERSDSWLEAIEHYEKAVKKWPENKSLKLGLRRSKIHFSIERRYSDRSFETLLLPKSKREAITMFDEVLDLVITHYVDPISPTSFVAHGTESLYVALADPKFLDYHFPNADPAKLDAACQRMRRILHEQFWNKRIARRADAGRMVSQASQIAQSVLGLSPSAAIMEYVFGGCNALDDYSSHLTPDRLEDLYGNIEGEFVGLGIEMKAEAGNGLKLVNVLPRSPASEGGMVAGDFIVSIDGTDCRDVSTDEGAKMLRGPTGSSVQLQLLGPTDIEPRKKVFFRRLVHVSSIPEYRMIDREAGIGYIRMAGFQKSSAAELDDALEHLRRQGMRSLIWDLRDNPGGLLQAAVEVLDRFIAKGVLVSTRGRNRNQNSTYSAYQQRTSNIRLVLLTDGNSASASEVVAGAIRDHRRGQIVGRTTYGKWSVQSIFPLGIAAGLKRQPGATGLRLTTAKFYSPRGQTLGKIGVRPDVVVERSDDQTTFFRGPSGSARDANGVPSDPDLRKGLEILRRQITQR